jgi:hypothetical protein
MRGFSRKLREDSGPGCWPMSRARLVCRADDAEQGGRAGAAVGATRDASQNYRG